ncbi:hypothetical protein Ahy_A02g006506 isoform C [Arachis hypogaea]|uniref:Uncharacterized protein n=1 Tax=Arachis hypogaea TaxID=3818 RepID=A0A445E9W6_ARAHY|nr:hypothetical protein Ahy_A02g006506 isoform C [Arachis hypogaea]
MEKKKKSHKTRGGTGLHDGLKVKWALGRFTRLLKQRGNPPFFFPRQQSYWKCLHDCRGNPFFPFNFGNPISLSSSSSSSSSSSFSSSFSSSSSTLSS